MTTTSANVAQMLLKNEVEEFLYHEAELLDDRRFAEWLDLLADDIRYWMPMRRNVKAGELDREFTGEGDINWFDEGKGTLERRVNQILTGVHWAEEPLSRICHMVSNVQLLEIRPHPNPPPEGEGISEWEDATEVGLKCRFLIYRNRVETETDFLIGKREDVLRKENGGWKIAQRKVILDQNVLLAKNLTFFF